MRPNPDAVDVTVPPPSEPWRLSVEEATMRMLQHNADLRTQELSPVIAGTFEAIERGVYDPELFAELSYGEQSALEVARATSDQFSVEAEDASAVVGVRQLLPTGTEIEATFGQEYSLSNRTPEQQEARIGLTVTQSLLRGFGPAANLTRVWQAERDTLASQFELRAYTEQLVADVESTYWRFVLVKEEIAIFERSLEIAKRQRDEAEQQIEVGLLATTEGAAARAEVALREQELIDARSELQSVRLELSYLLNVGEEGALEREFEAVSSPRTEANPLYDLDSRVRLAMRSRPELNEARLQVERNTLETVVTRNGLLPRLDFFVTLGRSGFGNSLSRSFDALDGPSYDLRTGLTLSHALGNRSARARDLAARATRQQAQAALENLEDLVELEVRQAATEVERARQQISASAASRELREQAAEAEEERFQVGSSTALLVAQAQRDLLASRIAEIEAIVDYRLALIQLYLAEGTLLERRGIVLRGTDVRL